MTETLQDLENHYRKEQRTAARLAANPSKKKGFFAGLIVGPFLIATALFVPGIGVILSTLACVLTLIHIVLVRSLSLALAYLAGACISIVGLGAVLSQFNSNMNTLIYIIIAFSTAVVLGYIVLVAGLIWQHYNIQEPTGESS